jgi:hypothetical protein
MAFHNGGGRNRNRKRQRPDWSATPFPRHFAAELPSSRDLPAQ